MVRVWLAQSGKGTSDNEPPDQDGKSTVPSSRKKDMLSRPLVYRWLPLSYHIEQGLNDTTVPSNQTEIALIAARINNIYIQL